MTDTTLPKSPDSRHAWWVHDAIAIAVFLALTTLAMIYRWVFDNWLARHDLLTFFLPWFDALGDRLRNLDIPGINPYIFAGAPFAGDPESGWLYLPAMLTFPFFEVVLAYKLMILIQLLIAGLGMYTFTRVVGFRVPAALFSAVAFAFGPYLYGQTDCCTVGTMATGFLPLSFLGIEIALRARDWAFKFSGWVLAAFAISQMFAAWLGQGVANALLLIALWVLFRTLITPPDADWSLKERLVQMITTGPAILIGGVLLGAGGLLPRLQANSESNNPGGTYEHTPGAWDGDFYTLSTALRSMFAEYDGYRGTSVWSVVAVLSVLAVLLSRRHSIIPYFTAATLLIPAIAMNTPILTDILYLIPLYENMQIHSPGRVFWLLAFFPTVLAGAAVNELHRLAGMRSRWVIVATAFLVVVAIGLYIRMGDGAMASSWYWAGTLLTTGVLAVIAAAGNVNNGLQRARMINLASAGLIALAVIFPNALDVGRSLFGPEAEPGELNMRGNDQWMQNLINLNLRRDDPGGAGEFLQQQEQTEGPFRFIAYGGMYHPDTVRRTYPDRRLEPAMAYILQNARPMRLELETTSGYNPLQPLVYQDFMAALNRGEQNYHYANLLHTGVNSPLIDLLNVRYIVVDRNIPENRRDIRILAENRTEVFRNEHVIIFENTSYQPRAWMVYDVRTDADGLDQLATGEVDGATVAFINEAEPMPAISSPSSGETQVTIDDRTADVITMNVDHNGDGLLVVSQIYSHNWTATVDGEDVPVIQTDHALVGIPVPGGEHTVELRYAPTTQTIGTVVTGASILGSIGILGWAGWQHATRRTLPPDSMPVATH